MTFLPIPEEEVIPTGIIAGLEQGRHSFKNLNARADANSLNGNPKEQLFEGVVCLDADIETN